jgi:hypothetical protein
LVNLTKVRAAAARKQPRWYRAESLRIPNMNRDKKTYTFIIIAVSWLLGIINLSQTSVNPWGG